MGVASPENCIWSVFTISNTLGDEICSSQGCDFGDLFGCDADRTARFVLRLLCAFVC